LVMDVEFAYRSRLVAAPDALRKIAENNDSPPLLPFKGVERDLVVVTSGPSRSVERLVQFCEESLRVREGLSSPASEEQGSCIQISRLLASRRILVGKKWSLVVAASGAGTRTDIAGVDLEDAHIQIQSVLTPPVSDSQLFGAFNEPR